MRTQRDQKSIRLFTQTQMDELEPKNHPFLHKSKVLRTLYSKVVTAIVLGALIPSALVIIYVYPFSGKTIFESAFVLIYPLIALFFCYSSTFVLIRRMLSSVSKANETLDKYLKNSIVAELPSTTEDELGQLNFNISLLMRINEGISKHLENYDSETGLPNRNLFIEKLSHSISEIREKKSSLYIPVFCIKFLNWNPEGLGSKHKEFFIKNISNLLRAKLPANTILSRTEEDQLSFFIPPSEQSHHFELENWSDEIEKIENQAFNLDSTIITASSRAGMAVYPFDAKSAEVLLQKSEAQISQSKGSIFHSPSLLSPELRNKMEEKYLIGKHLERAISNSEFYLQYQPRVSLQDGKIVSVEALIRWLHPTLGLLAPNSFLAIAEETGLIQELGLWVLETAMRDLQEWKKLGHPSIRMAINIAPKQLEDRKLPKKILKCVETYGNRIGELELEITESALISNLNRTLDILEELRSWGISIALDDFGTGYSSLSHLSQLPIRSLKIDHSFVERIVTDPNSLSISKTIVALGKSLGFRLIAEGVETEEQLNKIRDIGCDEAQGFYFSKPTSLLNLAQFSVR
ncbi:hypothetical protein CH373_14410 [Leptospira perolatii]|uniref:EAL domain-containing protein n=1 Tax=Leptospira perolatii TaxID=2023191 RepID=A0A2M9ZJW8_9LEPT|nr:GGDEF domain-containing phosphodiesterase [Leptospira perolatii]PJZ69270.1 hypothetical protein CH360_12210 [Leptospira perolatii]PJZ72348.1 hypothetical protein CH373_14410 [Leptospira perolatii]